MYNPIIYCCLNQRWGPCSPREMLFSQKSTLYLVFFNFILQVSRRLPSRLCMVSLHQSVWGGQDGTAAHTHVQGHHDAQPPQGERARQNKPRLWRKPHGERRKSAHGEEAGRRGARVCQIVQHTHCLLKMRREDALPQSCNDRPPSSHTHWGTLSRSHGNRYLVL